MKCPFCNTEMIHGYLNSGAAIWSERKHKISMLPDGKKKYALKLSTPLMSPHHVESYCCPACKRIIIDNRSKIKSKYGEESDYTGSSD